MTFEKKYKKAISLIHKNVKEKANKNKPLIPHLLRVGKYLHENKYSDTIVNAGLLHDALEWTNNSKEAILKDFGQKVLDIVVANTKDRNITDAEERRKDYVRRCADVGINALIVKSADVLDSFHYYHKKGNEKEMERSKSIAHLILEHIDASADPIFKELKKITDQ